jgi:hypothetical protein
MEVSLVVDWVVGRWHARRRNRRKQSEGCIVW